MRPSGRHADGGFTLIEMLVVVIVLGILTAIVIFAVGSLRTTSREQACKVEQRTVETAATAYKTETGAATIPPAPPGTSAERIQTLVDSGYLKSADLGTPGLVLDENGDTSMDVPIGTCT